MPHRIRLFSRQSLGAKLMSLLGSALLSSMILFALSVFYFTYRTEEEAWLGRQSEAARGAANTVSSFIQRVEDTLTVLSIVHPHEYASQSEEWRLLIEENPALLEIVHTDSSGTVIVDVNRDNSVLANLITIPQSQWFQQAKAGRTYIGSVQLSAKNEPYIIMAVPGRDGGVVAARVQMNVLWEVVRNIHFGRSGKVYAITLSGQIVAHTNPEVVLNNTTIQDRPEFKAMMAAPGHEWFGTFTNFEGQRVVGNTKAIQGTNWLIVTELPWTEAFMATQSAVLVLGAVALILAFAVSWRVGRSIQTMIVDPMEQVRQGAETIGMGDMDFRIDLPSTDEIGEMAAAFDRMADSLAKRDRQLAEQTVALKASELRYRAIVEDQTELICRFLPDGTLTFVNEAYCRYFGKSRQQLLGRRFLQFIPDEDEEVVRKQLNSLSPSCPVVTYEHRVILPDGTIRWQRWTDRALFEEEVAQEYASVGIDITEERLAVQELHRLNTELELRVEERTLALSQANENLTKEVNERKAAEDQVRASLQEKEVLLKEIHHRVKNNLQIISSLLNLQSRQVTDAGTLQALGDSQARVRSMALIHEKLYQSQSLAEIDFGEYVRTLTSDLFRSYQRNYNTVRLDIQTASVALELDLAVSCGLILNELMTNALKYAFPDGRSGTIWVELRATPERLLTLRVADDGVGFPANLDTSNTKTLGLQLVNNLVTQLDGRLDVQTSAGTEFQVTFQY